MVPSLAVIPVDLTEGAVQVMLLTGNESVVGAKAIVTPLKLTLFLFGAAVAIFACGKALSRLLKRRAGTV